MIPWRREWLATSVFLPGESHRQRSLGGYNPWCLKESDTTEWLTFSPSWPLKRVQSIIYPLVFLLNCLRNILAKVIFFIFPSAFVCFQVTVLKMIYLYWLLWFPNTRRLMFMHLYPLGLHKATAFMAFGSILLIQMSFYENFHKVKMLVHFPAILSWNDLGLENSH